MAISFVSTDQDQEVLKEIEKRFEVALPYVLPHSPGCDPIADLFNSEFPKEGVDASTYMAS